MKVSEHAREFWASYLRLGKSQKIFFGLFLIGCGMAGLYVDSVVTPKLEASQSAPSRKPQSSPPNDRSASS